MWIRSQNKKLLVKADEIWIKDTRIMCNSYGGDYNVLGIYNSDAETMKVLDTIQSAMFCATKTIRYYSNSEENCLGISVFQMPLSQGN